MTRRPAITISQEQRARGAQRGGWHRTPAAREELLDRVLGPETHAPIVNHDDCNPSEPQSLCDECREIFDGVARGARL